MKKMNHLAYKELLVAIRGRLRGDVTAMSKSALNKGGDESNGPSSMPIHMAELGSENFDQEFTLSLVETEEDTLTAIDAAIARIEEGTFGKCADCGGVIPKTRLNAIPYAPMCIGCAQKLEA